MPTRNIEIRRIHFFLSIILLLLALSIFRLNETANIYHDILGVIFTFISFGLLLDATDNI